MAVVVITEFMDDAGVSELTLRYDVLYDKDLAHDRERLIAALGDTRALVVRNQTQVDAALLAAAPHLEAVGRLGVGLDNIDLDACAANGVEVMPAAGANAVAVAEYVIGAMLVLARGKVFLSSERVAAGEWPREELLGTELMGKKLGLVGFGATAAEVCTRAVAMGVTVGAFDPLLPEDHPRWATAQRQEMDDLTATSDVLSLHVPLTPGTANLVDAAFVASMRPGAILVNTSRGGIVDEAALCDALRSGQLGGAALDVFADEPVSAAAGGLFSGVPNLLLTPHIAGVTEESNARISEITAANVIRVLGEGQ